jgi:dCMP deaminase
MMRTAYVQAMRATCPRRHVGAVLTNSAHRIVATGYNGAPREQPSCDEIGCQMVDDHCVRTLHAESNAIDYAGVFAAGCTLYVTVTPCWDCAKRIINANITRVLYDEHYESRYGKSMDVPDFLRAGGVEVDCMKPETMARYKALMQLVDVTTDLPSDMGITKTGIMSAREYATQVPPAACAIHRFHDDVCVVCGISDAD